MEEAEMTVQQDAKKIIIYTIQRIGAEEAIDNTVSVLCRIPCEGSQT